MSSDDPAASTPAVPRVSRDAVSAGAPSEMRARFLDFYESELPYVVKFLMMCGVGLHDAQDAAQEAFTEAWQLACPPQRWSAVENKRAWIRTVALRRHGRPPGPRRRPNTVPTGDPPDVPHPAADHAELTVSTLFVLDALSRLEPDARVVIALDLDDVPTSDIAGILDITEQRVRDLRKKGRRVLARGLGGNEAWRKEQWIR